MWKNESSKVAFEGVDHVCEVSKNLAENSTFFGLGFAGKRCSTYNMWKNNILINTSCDLPIYPRISSQIGRKSVEIYWFKLFLEDVIFWHRSFLMI